MNKFLCTGNLSKDVEKRETNDGKAVANFSIAVAKFSGEGADFFNVVVWGNQAENCAKYLKKGSKVGIVGSLQNRSYEDKDGIKRTLTEIIANDVEFLTPKNNSTKDEEQIVYTQKDRPKLESIDDNLLPF